MSTQVNIHEAKTHFSRLVERAAAGEEIVIAKAGEPRARLVPLERPTSETPAGRLDEGQDLARGRLGQPGDERRRSRRDLLGTMPGPRTARSEAPAGHERLHLVARRPDPARRARSRGDRGWLGRGRSQCRDGLRDPNESGPREAARSTATSRSTSSEKDSTSFAVTIAHAVAAGSLPAASIRDPFDRLLIGAGTARASDRRHTRCDVSTGTASPCSPRRDSQAAPTRSASTRRAPAGSTGTRCVVPAPRIASRCARYQS